jgi:hypothetical protein
VVEAVDLFERNRRVVEDFSTRTLSAIPSEYGRLVYVAMLRDVGTGRYLHAGLSAVHPEGAVHEVLAESHQEIFARILETPLELQLVDLRACLHSLGSEASYQAGRWRELEIYRALIPNGVPGPIRELYCANLDALLSVVQEESPTAASVS